MTPPPYCVFFHSILKILMRFRLRSHECNDERDAGTCIQVAQFVDIKLHDGQAATDCISIESSGTI